VQIYGRYHYLWGLEKSNVLSSKNMTKHTISLLARLFLLICCLTPSLLAAKTTHSYPAFSADSILQQALKVDDYIRLVKHPDYWDNTVVGGKSRPSNIWTRAVFYEGHMALNGIHPDSTLYHYAYDWGKAHNWEMAYKKNTTQDGDNQCCGQTYLDLYRLSPDPAMINTVKSCLDYCIKNRPARDWTWIDAIQMAMPVYAKLGTITGNTKYWDYMHKGYLYTRDTIDVTGLFNPEDAFWWRDKNWNSQDKYVNGKPVYWSRGNGWVYAALVRVMNELPETSPYHAFYKADYLAMSASLLACQREDGFWNPDLINDQNYGGKETSGTGLFVYGLAWGLNKGWLDRETYLEAVLKGWTSISRDAVHPNGFLGWMQGTGDDPSDGQPFSYTAVPNFEDYGAGCVLLAAAESYKLAQTLAKEDSLSSLSTTRHPSILRHWYQNRQLYVETAEPATLHVLTLSGQEVATQDVPAGQHKVTLPARKGMYVVTVLSNNVSKLGQIKGLSF